MSGFIVEGKCRLKGTIHVTGNKNEALPLIAASLLCPGPVTFTNIPEIGDVAIMLSIASLLGVEVSPLKNGRVTLAAGKIISTELPLRESAAIRASILFASALLVREGRAVIRQPGGDSIGRRRLDTHFAVFKAFGARLRVERAVSPDGTARETRFILTAHTGGLKGTTIHLDESSVTATENDFVAQPHRCPSSPFKEVVTL